MKTTINNQKGFTLIELVVVMVILALLAAVAVPKFLDLQKQAEAASVKKVIGNMKSALSIRVAQGLVNGEDISLLAFNGNNPSQLDPMADLLSNKPETYRGVIGNSTNGGDWFDDTNGQDDLVYVFKNAGIINDGTNDNISGYQLRYHIVRILDGGGATVGLELQQRVPAALTWNY